MSIETLLQRIRSNEARNATVLSQSNTDQIIPPLVAAIQEGMQQGDCSLNQINFSHSDINDENALLLAGVIATHPSLTKVTLDHCNLSRKSADALVEAICRNPRLTDVTMHGNPEMDIEDAVAKVLAAHPPNLLHFHPGDDNTKLQHMLQSNTMKAEGLAYKVLLYNTAPLSERDHNELDVRLPAVESVVAYGHIATDNSDTSLTLSEFTDYLTACMNQAKMRKATVRNVG